jgi:hypothetical protein
VIDAADHRLLRGPDFYDLFIDRSRWPELIRAGYERTTRALDAFRPGTPAHATAPAAAAEHEPATATAAAAGGERLPMR